MRAKSPAFGSLEVLVAIITSCSFISAIGLVVEAKRAAAPTKLSQQHRAWGFIYTSGIAIIKPSYDAAFPFAHGVAKVQLNESTSSDRYEKRDLYVDKHGNPARLEGDLSLKLKKIGNKYGYADASGKIVLPVRWDFADEFKESRAVVGTGNRFNTDDAKSSTEFKIIDLQGHVICDLGKNEPIHDFRNGLLEVRSNHKYGFLNKFGKFVIEPQFNLCGTKIINTG